MKEYQAYLFDWDGTLGRTLEVWLTVVREMFTKYGISNLTDDQLVESLGALKPKAIEFGLAGARLEAFFQETEQVAKQRVPHADMYEGAREVLDSVKSKGHKLALITTGWRTTVNALLVNHSLETMFDVVISGNDVVKHKPDPEGINTTLRELGVDASQALMIGDSSNDLLAAQNAAVDSLLFYPPNHQLFYDLPTLTGHAPKHVIAGWNEFAQRLAV